jgi:hypothetical protein
MYNVTVYFTNDIEKAELSNVDTIVDGSSFLKLGWEDGVERWYPVRYIDCIDIVYIDEL